MASGGVIFFSSDFMHEPSIKRTIAFVDGQNLFYAAKYAFGASYPNYDPLLLARMVCNTEGWSLQTVYFYTGIPDVNDNPDWNYFWTGKLAVMGTRGIKTFSRHLSYQPRQVALPTGGTTTILVGQEKGIDIRIALDMVRLARENEYDVALLFSQDQDLSEVVDEIKQISREDDRWIKVACAFPASSAYRNYRGIHGTDWIRIDNATYYACVDPNDYRPKKPAT